MHGMELSHARHGVEHPIVVLYKGCHKGVFTNVHERGQTPGNAFSALKGNLQCRQTCTQSQGNADKREQEENIKEYIKE